MTIPTFLLTAFGDWIEANFSVIFLVSGQAIVQLCALVIILTNIRGEQGRMKQDVKDLDQRMDENTERIRTHMGDDNKHVNHLYMGQLQRKIDGIESEMKSGHDKIREHIDKRFDALAARMGK